MSLIAKYVSNQFSLENHKNSFFDFDKIKDFSYDKHEKYNTLLMNPITEKQRQDMLLYPEGFIKENIHLHGYEFKIIAARNSYDFSIYKKDAGIWTGEIYIEKTHNLKNEDINRLFSDKCLKYKSRNVILLPDSKRIQVKFSSPELGDYTPFGDISLCKDKVMSYFCGDDVMEWMKEFIYKLF